MPLPFDRFVKTTTIPGGAAPSNANDGQDPIGFALSGATFTFSTLTINSVGAFAGYTVTAGDVVGILAATGGVVPGTYTIASSPTDDDLILAADPGLTADATAVSSSDGPWLTLQFAADNTTPDLACAICNDGDGGVGTPWTPSATIDFDINDGGPDGVRFYGATDRGFVDFATQATISGTSLPATTDLVNIAIGDLSFSDIRFTAATQHNVFSAGSGVPPSNFVRCRFDNAAGSGLLHEGANWAFTDCEADNNGDHGISMQPPGGARGGHHMIGCTIHDNGLVGVFTQPGSPHYTKCLFYNNGLSGVRVQRTGANITFENCTFWNNTGAGIDIVLSWVSGPLGVFKNCTFVDNGTWAADFGGGASAVQFIACLFFNNTSGDVNGQRVDIYPSSVFADPLFTDTTPASPDFTPQAGSPLVAAGVGGPDS